MTDEYLTAIHEAGHAVMSVMLHRAIEFVTVVESDDYSGLCQNKETNLDEYSMEFDSYRRKIRREIMILFAGYIAIGNHELPINWQEAEIESDFNKVFDLVMRVSGTEEHTGKFFYKYWSKTVELINQPLIQQQIKAVADALMEKKTLSGDEVRQIIKVVNKGGN